MPLTIPKTMAKISAVLQSSRQCSEHGVLRDDADDRRHQLHGGVEKQQREVWPAVPAFLGRDKERGGDAFQIDVEHLVAEREDAEREQHRAIAVDAVDRRDGDDGDHDGEGGADPVIGFGHEEDQEKNGRDPGDPDDEGPFLRGGGLADGVLRCVLVIVVEQGWRQGGPGAVPGRESSGLIKSGTTGTRANGAAM